MCVIWGSDDLVIPVQARRASRPRSRPTRAGRGDPQRRPLPAQGPPRAVREDRQRLHPHHRARESTAGQLARPARCRVRTCPRPRPTPHGREPAGSRYAPPSVADRPRRRGQHEARAAQASPPSCLTPGDGGRVVDAVARRRPRDGLRLDLAARRRAPEGLDDDRLGVDLEEAAGGRAGVGEAEAVGARARGSRRAPSGRSAAARRACSRRPRRPGPRRPASLSVTYAVRGGSPGCSRFHSSAATASRASSFHDVTDQGSAATPQSSASSRCGLGDPREADARGQQLHPRAPRDAPAVADLVDALEECPRRRRLRLGGLRDRLVVDGEVEDDVLAVGCSSRRTSARRPDLHDVR